MGNFTYAKATALAQQAGRGHLPALRTFLQAVLDDNLPAAGAGAEADTNTGYGTDALDSNLTGVRNTAIGNDALTALTNGTDNVAVGSSAGDALTTGDKNILIGTDAGGALTTGGDNVGIGDDALLVLTTGNDNLAIGRDAGKAITTGEKNICIGSGAGNITSSGSTNITIGVDADPQDATAVDQITIGHGLTNTADNACVIGNGSAHVRNDFGTDATWDQVSDERRKTDIEDSPLGLAFINELRPVTFRWKDREDWPEEWPQSQFEAEIDTDTVMTGFLAQDVKAAIDITAPGERFAGWSQEASGMQRTSKEMMVFPLVNAVKELTARLETLESGTAH